MSETAKIAKSLLGGYYRALKVLMSFFMATMIVAVALQIVAQFVDAVPRYIWTEEAARFCFVWIIMLGSAVAVRDGTHFDVDLLPHPRTDRAKGLGNLVVHAAMMVLAMLFLRYGVEFAEFGFRQSSEMSSINMLSIYIAFPVAGATWILFLVEHLVRDMSLISGPPTGTRP
jgi:TRAP-type C4-dicarboxylate transport system permease small subunit